MGELPEASPIKLEVQPLLGQLPDVNPIEVGVTPILSPLPEIKPIEVEINPTVGQIPEVTPIIEPLPDVPKKEIKLGLPDSPLAEIEQELKAAPPLEIAARLKIDTSNLSDLQAKLTIPPIQAPEQISTGNQGLARLGEAILAKLDSLGLKIPNTNPVVNATFNNSFASTNERELLRKARNQNLSDIETVFNSAVAAI
jgi:hypothetical protein